MTECLLQTTYYLNIVRIDLSYGCNFKEKQEVISGQHPMALSVTVCMLHPLKLELHHSGLY